MDKTIVLKEINAFEVFDSWDGMPKSEGFYRDEVAAKAFLKNNDGSRATDIQHTLLYEDEYGGLFKLQPVGKFRDDMDKILQSIKGKLSPEEIDFLKKNGGL